MAEPTITDVFGAGASQTATTLTIEKSDLAATGLTASATNSAESLLVAIALTAKAALTENNFGSNSDQSVTIVPGFDSIVAREASDGTFVSTVQNQFNLNLHKPANTVLSADDY